jgi:exodeoxyribonuclease VII large subunit
MTLERKIFSLNQLATSFENFIAKRFATESYWVSAEIAKHNTKGGHHYFELVETHQGQLLAQIQGNLWFSNYRTCKAKYGEAIDEILQTGNKSLFLVRIEYHKIFGLKLNILDIDPAYSYGEMERQKQLNAARLKEEGLFFKQKSLYLPRICKRIAIIGSPDTSGFRDFMKILLENDFFTNFTVRVFPSTVQGNEAKFELIKQIREVQNYTVDAVVLIRGGGSKTDLNIFNDYDVCKAICTCQLPIVTGIGHETDDVLAAHVSRLDCITPTAAAKHFYVQISSFLSEIRSNFDVIIQQSLILLQAHQLEFNEAHKRLGYSCLELLNNRKKDLGDLSQHLFRTVHFTVLNQYQELEILLLHLETNALKKITAARDIEIKSYLVDIQIALRMVFVREMQNLNQLEILLELLNPLTLLGKGYTISTVNDREVHEIKEIKIGDELKTLSSELLITSTITNFERTKYGDDIS